jgi:hypothetical protein
MPRQARRTACLALGFSSALLAVWADSWKVIGPMGTPWFSGNSLLVLLPAGLVLFAAFAVYAGSTPEVVRTARAMLWATAAMPAVLLVSFLLLALASVYYPDETFYSRWIPSVLAGVAAAVAASSVRTRTSRPEPPGEPERPAQG